MQQKVNLAPTSPKVTIGMPVYNGSNFIEEALISLLGQSFSDFELIICDNASTDTTLEIARRYATQDSRIKIYTADTNYGAAWNYNRCVQLAQGEYFRWHAHDDKISPNALALCVNSLDNNPDAVLAYPETLIIDSHGEVCRQYFDKLNLGDDGAHKRFTRVVHRQAECNTIFGLIRLNQLKQTAQIASFVASDCTLLAELALLGKFYEIHGTYFYRRDHDKTSLRANSTDEQVELWFNTQKEPSGMRYVPFAMAYANAIRRSPLDIKERYHCYSILGHWICKYLGKISRELYAAIARSFFRTFRLHKVAN
jgi:glycosyltransferase involved in cell wall biosynthesis